MWPRIKKYKSGEVPQIGDLVMRKYANVDYPLQYCYGIVMGTTILGSGVQLPVILWGGRSNPRKSLLGGVHLIGRKGSENEKPV